MSAVLERDVADLRVALSDPGPFLAFSTGDPGANNFMFDGSDGRLFDFEFAGYRNALADASVLHVPGPM